ncbi:MAG: OmpA family protein [Burkholderiaceae bacterium]|nr:OmpA family protein [Burkholderiaceae bacterium]
MDNVGARGEVAGAGAIGGAAGATAAAAPRGVTLTRLVRRVEDGPGVLWAALLPAAGLAALAWFGMAPFASHDIEASVAAGVRAQLLQHGHGWVQVGVTGQEVLLSGTPPSPGAGGAALAAARAATCPTWAGPQVCAVLVLGDFGSPGGVAAPALAQVAPAAPAAPAVSTASPAPPAAAASTPATAPASLPAAPAAASTPAERTAQACEASFIDLLENTRLEFASGGSAIDARSAPLLDRLAAAAGACPGRVLIEGHTDNVGDAGANQRLSEARATAVRDALVARGLPAERLVTVGHGDTRPLADNTTDTGRAANRRIEFKAAP